MNTIPIPVPMAELPTADPWISLLTALVTLTVALLLRALWRLPERQAHSAWVVDAGGAVAVQNRALHALGYLAIVFGTVMGGFSNGVVIALLAMVAASVRAQRAGL